MGSAETFLDPFSIVETKFKGSNDTFKGSEVLNFENEQKAVFKPYVRKKLHDCQILQHGKNKTKQKAKTFLCLCKISNS